MQVTVSQIITWYRDADNDGYGTASLTKQACSKPTGYVAAGGDCNDNNPAINPGKAEICGNGIDDNCNGQADEGCNIKATLSISDVAVYETARLVTVQVTLSKKVLDKDVKVKYATKDGTAKANGKKKDPADYSTKNGTIIIPAGSQSATITIPILAENPNVKEPVERFTVVLSSPVNALIAKGTGTVTITDRAPLTIATNTTTPDENMVYEATGQFSVKAYPNPTYNYFTIVTHSSSTLPVNIRVTDILGRVIEMKSNLAASGTITLGNKYKKGIYIVEVVQGAERQVLKLIKDSD